MMHELLHFVGAWMMAMAVHELAHAAVARACGVWVQRITVFWDLGGVQLARWKARSTTVVIGWFPFLSMVELAGQAREDLGGTDALPDRPYEVQAKAPWKRIAIYLAGAVANVALAITLMEWWDLPVCHWMVWMNVWLAAMNLGPFGRTDGGRALDLALRTWNLPGPTWAWRASGFLVIAGALVLMVARGVCV